MGKKRDRESWVLNNQTYMMYYNRLRDYALSMFEWEGLPDSINERFLEVKMYEEGSVVWFTDPSFGLLALPVMKGGEINFYNEPTSYNAVSTGYNRKLDPEEAVIMYANYSRTPIDPIIRQYAHRLFEITRTQDVNVKAQKTPVLLLADESQRMTLLNAYQQFDGNEPMIFGNKKGFDPESVSVLKTDAPYVSDKLQVLKNEIWNEAMTFLGVGNAKQDKKERLVEAEVSANDEQVEGAREIMLKSRRQACEQINKMFGTKISVDFKFQEVEIDKGEGENGDGANNR